MELSSFQSSVKLLSALYYSDASYRSAAGACILYTLYPNGQLLLANPTGSGELLWVHFDMEPGTQNPDSVPVSDGAGVKVLFTDPPKYSIGFCHENV